MAYRQPHAWTLVVDGIAIAVRFKAVKRINLVVSAPDGNVRLSAPHKTGREAIRKFVESRLDWIKKQTDALRRPAAEICDGCLFPVWGRAYRLRLHAQAGCDQVKIVGDELHVHVAGCEASGLLAVWRGSLVAEAAPPLIRKWRTLAGAPEARLTVRKMKTRWGSCSPMKRHITLNSELAAKGPEYLEYVVVHELAHFQHPNHGAGFQALMDALLPGWRQLRKRLNEPQAQD